jgi:murein DD-endopeptidase MepM/ murein hydrolase activator NlpD
MYSQGPSRGALAVIILGLLMGAGYWRFRQSQLSTPLKVPQITSDYGYRYRGGLALDHHEGIDIVPEKGDQNVRASEEGLVIHAGPLGKMGNTVVIHHTAGSSSGIVTLYGHLKSSLKVRCGQGVTKKQEVGEMGRSGAVTGPHLHYAILEKRDQYWGYVPPGRYQATGAAIALRNWVKTSLPIPSMIERAKTGCRVAKRKSKVKMDATNLRRKRR